MTPQWMNYYSSVIFLALLCPNMGYSPNKYYRFDYEWVSPAQGWLKYHAVPATWDQARMRCQAEGAILASPTTQLKSIIISFVQKQKGTGPKRRGTIFTGVHATFSQGDYSSIEGDPLLRLPITWAPGQPDNFNNSERCLAMNTGNNGTMSDTRCDRVLPYVCYKKYEELYFNECGTSDREYVLESSTGSCYKFHERGLPWREAYMTCIAEGGYLAIIKDEVEVKVVKEIFGRHPKRNIQAASHNAVFVGFHDWGHYGFRPIHDETPDTNFPTWNSGQPSNSTKKAHNSTNRLRLDLDDQHQYCGSVTKAVKFIKSPCNTYLAFLCEMTPLSLYMPNLSR